jgi:hypothetical protein
LVNGHPIDVDSPDSKYVWGFGFKVVTNVLVSVDGNVVGGGEHLLRVTERIGS